MKSPHLGFNATPSIGEQDASGQQLPPSIAAGPQITIYLDREAVKHIASTGPALVKIIPYGMHKRERDALIFEFGEGGHGKDR